MMLDLYLHELLLARAWKPGDASLLWLKVYHDLLAPTSQHSTIATRIVAVLVEQEPSSFRLNYLPTYLPILI